MRVVQINTTCSDGSTGKICVSISEILRDADVENYIIYTARKSNFIYGIKCGNYVNKKMQALKSRIFGNYGFNSKKTTKQIIKQIEKIKPNIVHIHNIHGHDCDLGTLFTYLKKQKIKIFWTFHDCWAFTGYCTHYDMINCEKWQHVCNKCPQVKEYSWFFDRSQVIFNKKKELFSDLDLTIITPSEWLKEQVGKSFLKNYPVIVINNGINTSIFKPTQSDFQDKYNCNGKYIVLGVSFSWDYKKGLDVFVELANRMGNRYQIVLVGTNDEIDKKLPENIISIHRTQNQTELAEIYTAADVFVNPTREENYPTVNMEAIACGTPVVTFCTGGSPEIITGECGSVVKKDDIDALEKEIKRICIDNPYSAEGCVKYSKIFDSVKRYEKYLELYRRYI